ncbi:MAG: acylphosphatase [Gemmiger formicilis]|uniref:acylphosphatase n=1 Tax=Gemmiger formicilis TaxID=745368 RepID=UPI003A267A11
MSLTHDVADADLKTAVEARDYTVTVSTHERPPPLALHRHSAGVGFAMSRAAALHLGLTGWVANNWDAASRWRPGERAALDALVPHRAQPLGPHRER